MKGFDFMKKITKKEFVVKIVSNETYFVTIHKYINKSIQAKLEFINDEIAEHKPDFTTMEARTCVPHSSFLEFSNSGRLFLNQTADYSFYKFEIDSQEYLIAVETTDNSKISTNSWDDVISYFMIYAIKK
jgi:hypothetical protein